MPPETPARTRSRRPPAVPPDPARVREEGLRHEVRLLVTRAGHQRLLPARCHVGHPGGEVLRLPALPGDASAELRGVLVERAVEGLTETAGAACWVTRSGRLETDLDDLVWSRAATAGFAAHGLEAPRFYLLTRQGWLEPATGRSRTWRRVRALPRAPEESPG